MSRFLARGVLLAALAAGCGGHGDPSGPPVANRLTVLSGSNQTGPAGAVLPVPIRVVAENGQGGVSGVVIQASAATGVVLPASATTNSLGQADFSWHLGGSAGSQTLSFSSGSQLTTTATATAVAGPAASVLPVSEAQQTVVVGRAVGSLPRVQVTDEFGNVVAGVPVTFDAPVSGSTISGTQRVSDAAGLATLGSWTIGPDAQLYTVRAQIAGGVTALFEARGVPAGLLPIGGSGLNANAGTAVASAPAVKAIRDDASPLPHVPVTFVVTSGNGQIDGATTETGADGIARLAAWRLGPVPGPNSVEARTAGRDPVVFTATGLAAVAAAMTATTPVSQSGFFGNYPRFQPAVRIADAGGQPVFGAAVSFLQVQGDGALLGTTTTTDANGDARIGAWRLGSAATSVVRASSTGLTPVDFSAAAGPVPASTFRIEVRFLNAPTPSQQAVFTQAAARWSQLIVGGDAPFVVSAPAGSCFPALNETVDGVLIFVNAGFIDGPGGILGQAGPCIVRNNPGYLAVVGLMEFDTGDLAALEANGHLTDVILHEMAHVLGFGTIWNFQGNHYLTDPGSFSPSFNGGSARAAFLGAAQGTFSGTPVPVEGRPAAAGTRDAHWRESAVHSELMTGFLDAGANPLSAFTAASFRDLGYLVNDLAADGFTFQAAVQAAGPPSGVPGSGIALREGTLPGPILVINRRGGVVARVGRF